MLFEEIDGLTSCRDVYEHESTKRLKNVRFCYAMLIFLITQIKIWDEILVFSRFDCNHTKD